MLESSVILVQVTTKVYKHLHVSKMIKPSSVLSTQSFFLLPYRRWLGWQPVQFVKLHWPHHAIRVCWETLITPCGRQFLLIYVCLWLWSSLVGTWLYLRIHNGLWASTQFISKAAFTFWQMAQPLSIIFIITVEARPLRNFIARAHLVHMLIKFTWDC